MRQEDVLRSRDFLNGPKIAAWFRERGVTNPEKQLGEMRQSLWDWENGTQATVWTVDEMLVKLGWSPDLDQFPDDFWEPPKGRRRKSVFHRWNALRMLREGKSVMEVARSNGVSPQSVRKWRKAAGL